ncbi:MAG TPA: 16S rRNA (uracil(1498)-N(3))-methyltransferase [Rhodanobacteraceae bacterium]|nr:16S rRNA (uracil(1498)-N(3))-methyltransferase [Rhodanobacteraceae bacterium]
MRTVRIHVEQPLTPGVELALPAQAAAHVVRVLRLHAGDPVVLFNGDGNDYASELVETTARAVRVRIIDARVVGNESPLRITLAQALARGEKMDWIIQKATELGATAIVPLFTERSEVRLDGARADKRLAHWRAVAIGACEQCGRARVPGITAPLPLDAWLATLPQAKTETRLALLPEGELGARALEHPGTEIRLAVGPEGGFASKDIAALRADGFRGLSLGPRVLRTETAGTAALAALQAIYGDAG